jgi:hypothetical protein
VSCAGALPIGATNCLNFGNPERPEINRTGDDFAFALGIGLLAAGHFDVGIARADLARGSEAFVGVGRWHADVDDRDVRLVRAHLQHQLVRSAGLADDLDPCVVEQPRDPLAQKHGILGDDDAHPRFVRRRGPGSSAAVGA